MVAPRIIYVFYHNTDFVNELAALEGVQSAVLVSYNGEYMG